MKIVKMNIKKSTWFIKHKRNDNIYHIDFFILYYKKFIEKQIDLFSLRYSCRVVSPIGSSPFRVFFVEFLQNPLFLLFNELFYNLFVTFEFLDHQTSIFKCFFQQKMAAVDDISFVKPTYIFAIAYRYINPHVFFIVCFF